LTQPIKQTGETKQGARGKETKRPPPIWKDAKDAKKSRPNGRKKVAGGGAGGINVKGKEAGWRVKKKVGAGV